MSQIGRMTLYKVIELADDLMNIRVESLRELSKIDPNLDVSPYSTYPMVRRAHALKGDTVSVAQCLKLKEKWKNWTWKDGVTISTVQGFLSSEIVRQVTNI